MKAVVIKTKGKDATLLGDDGQFVIRRNHNYKMGDMVIMKSKTISKRIVALAATAAMLVFMMSAAVVAYVTPAYYVSLDVNPSLLMKVNFFNQLIGLEAMNEDAAAIVESLDWKFKTVDDVLAMALEKIEQKGYLDEGGNILLAAAGKGETRTADLLADLKAIIDEIDIEDVEIEADAAGLAMVESAREFGMTPGKYNLITKLLGETVNVDNMEAYQEEAVKDLMGRFTATKGSIGKETAASAKQNAPDVTLPAQADAGKENSDQKASETVANATQKASEARPGVTQSLPANVTLPTVPPVVVPQPPVIVPTEPAVVGTVPPTIVPVEPDLPSVPSISIPRP